MKDTSEDDFRDIKTKSDFKDQFSQDKINKTDNFLDEFFDEND